MARVLEVIAGTQPAVTFIVGRWGDVGALMFFVGEFVHDGAQCSVVGD